MCNVAKRHLVPVCSRSETTRVVVVSRIRSAVIRSRFIEAL